ncbi:hypothetical protein P8452_53331 [Trifolium repens]|nr:hypothetical protein P8452_53331 [Trifolium repens]
MGKEAQNVPSAAVLYKKANEILGFDLLDVCINGPKEKLNSTVISQPALYVTSPAAVELLRAREGGEQLIDSVDVTCGLSLGEYTALAFAGAFSEKETSIISIVQCVVNNNLFHQDCVENGTFMRFGREVTDDELMTEIKYREFVEIDDEFREMKTDILYFFKRFRLRSNIYNYVLGILAAYSVAEPLYRLIMGVSILNLDGQTRLAPFEIVSLIVEAIARCSMLILLAIETKVYVYEFRWFVRFGLVYAAVGGAVMFTFIISVQELYSRSVLYLYISEVVCQALFKLSQLVTHLHIHIYSEPLSKIPTRVILRRRQIIDVTGDFSCALCGGERN